MSANFFFLYWFFTSLGKPTFDIISFILGHFTLGRCPFYSQCFTQLNVTLKIFLRGWLLVLGLKACLVECATLCVKSEVMLIVSNWKWITIPHGNSYQDKAKVERGTTEIVPVNNSFLSNVLISYLCTFPLRILNRLLGKL